MGKVGLKLLSCYRCCRDDAVAMAVESRSGYCLDSVWSRAAIKHSANVLFHSENWTFQALYAR